MSLNFYQRHRNLEPILKNDFYDDQGQTVYKVHTPAGLNRTTTISKALNDNSLTDTVGHDASATSLDEGLQVAVNEESVDDSTGLNTNSESSAPTSPTPGMLPEAHTNFVYIAQIDWRVIKSTKIRFGDGRYSGREVLAKDFFKKQQLGRGYVFTGEDGKEYKWHLDAIVSTKLTSNDTSKTPIATFHRGNLLSKKDPAHLEIFPEGQHMMDEIFVTFIYIEQKRKEAGEYW